MNKINPEVDEYFKKAQKWQKEAKALRKILLDCQLTEELKWRQAGYTYEGKNIVLIQAFKEYCALLFFKGALLKDAKRFLVRPGENTQAGRQIRFTSVREITEKENILKAYISEAIAAEKAGLKVTKKTTADYAVPEEFQTKLNKMPALKKAFTALTPGRQRAYLLYFSAAKQSTTRESRIEKHIKQILKGKGLND